MIKKYWKDRYELLKQEYDKTLIELMNVKRDYNSLIDKYKDQLDTNHQLRRTLNLCGAIQKRQYESNE